MASFLLFIQITASLLLVFVYEHMNIFYLYYFQEEMQGKLLAIVALVMMMIQNSNQALELTTSTVVGNVLFEQSTMYVMAVLMLVLAMFA